LRVALFLAMPEQSMIEEEELGEEAQDWHDDHGGNPENCLKVR
jgi:hypothetical protein